VAKKKTLKERDTITMDRRGLGRDGKGKDRAGISPSKQADVARPERRKVSRRRQIDPTTCEREYSEEEIEFMRAMDTYRRTSGRMFPTCSEILEVLRSIGYQKSDSSGTAEMPSEAPPAVDIDLSNGCAVS
jgi:hypothetical protein